MTFDEYCKKIGKIIINLHGLEFALRGFLSKFNESQEPPVNNSNFYEGNFVPENSFTNYDTLGALINKYNNIIEINYPNYSIDEVAVEIRDMLAHGRIASDLPDVIPPKLLKFGKSSKGRVEVTHSVELNDTWLNNSITAILDQIKKVYDVSNLMGQSIMSSPSL